MFKTLKKDIQNIFIKDPAAKNTLEVVLCYPGLHAIWLHRIAYWFYRNKRYTIARIVSHINRHITVLKYIPEPKSEEDFFIDHGMGVVIGETTEIGDNARIGAGSVVVTDVPPNATVVGVPGRIGMGFSTKEIQALEHGKLPDPIADAIHFFMKEQDNLKERIKKLETLEGIKKNIDEHIDKRKEEIENAFFSKGKEEFGKGA